MTEKKVQTVTEEAQQSQAYTVERDNDEIDLLELWQILWQGKWFVLGFPLLCTLIAVYMTLFVMPVTYKSIAVLQPTNVQADGMSKLKGLAANLPVDLPMGGQGDKSLQIVSFLKSRRLKKDLIEKYDLLPKIYTDIWNSQQQKWLVEDPESRPTLVKALQSGVLNSKFNVSQNDENGLITIGWIDEKPQRTKSMLEGVIKETRDYLENGYETDAERERQFVAKQLAKAKQELAYWEKQVPSNNLTKAEIQREHMAAQTVYTELRKQLELAKISEAKEVVRFKVLDEPFVPEQRHEPKRSLVCALTLVASGMAAIFLVFLWQFIKNARERMRK